MKSEKTHCISLREMFERLVQLESEFKSNKDSAEKALIIARDILDVKLEAMNNFQHRFDQLTGTLVSKEQLDREVKNAREHTDSQYKTNSGRIDLLAKLLYIGVGLVLGLELLLKYIFK